MTPTTSLVLASDYLVPSREGGWPVRSGWRDYLRALGARRVLLYRALDDPRHVFVTMGVHKRGPMTRLLRSLAEFYIEAEVDEMPPIFGGQLVERLALVDLAEDDLAADPEALIAAIAPAQDPAGLWNRIQNAADGFRAAGVRRLWLYRALDDGHEVMLLVEVDTEAHARTWLANTDELQEWLHGTGVGAYPPIFVGKLEEELKPPPAEAGE